MMSMRAVLALSEIDHKSSTALRIFKWPLSDWNAENECSCTRKQSDDLLRFLIGATVEDEEVQG